MARLAHVTIGRLKPMHTSPFTTESLAFFTRSLPPVEERPWLPTEDKVGTEKVDCSGRLPSRGGESLMMGK